MHGISLKGKVILITGGGRGLGLAMARGLAGAGAHVVAASHLQDDIEALNRSDEPIGEGGDIAGLCADLRDPEACRGVVDETLSRHGRIDGLINSAGIAPALIAPDHTDPDTPPHTFWETPDETVTAVMAVNYVAANRMASLVAPHMVAAGWGRIINVTTMIETMFRQGVSCYGASKAALEMASEIWHKDLSGTGVSVNILNPGGAADTAGLALARREGARRGTMGPLIPPEKMAAPAIWLCSTESDGISGMRFDADPWDETAPPAEEAARIGRPLGLRLIPRP